MVTADSGGLGDSDDSGSESGDKPTVVTSGDCVVTTTKCGEILTQKSVSNRSCAIEFSLLLFIASIGRVLCNYIGESFFKSLKLPNADCILNNNLTLGEICGEETDFRIPTIKLVGEGQ